MENGMRNFETGMDKARGIVLCRIAPGFDGNAGRELAAELAGLVAEARMTGPLKVLWDNRAGRTIAQETTDSVHALFERGRQPGDRIAVVVPNSVAKMHARPRITGGTELFASENAALTWLSVGSAAAA